jgi:hypothetical protein
MLSLVTVVAKAPYGWVQRIGFSNCFMTQAPVDQHAISGQPNVARVRVIPQCRCPRCGSVHVRRMRRNWIERAITKISQSYPHICRECTTKFYTAIDFD